jgi:hypothetical protein
MSASTATRRAYREVTPRREDKMSAQPDHAPVAPAPGAPAELLAQLRADRRAGQWVPAFEREWEAAHEESRRTFSLAGLYEVVQVWQGPASPPPRRSTRSSRPATTTASSSTCPGTLDDDTLDPICAPKVAAEDALRAPDRGRAMGLGAAGEFRTAPFRHRASSCHCWLVPVPAGH